MNAIDETHVRVTESIGWSGGFLPHRMIKSTCGKRWRFKRDVVCARADGINNETLLEVYLVQDRNNDSVVIMIDGRDCWRLVDKRDSRFSWPKFSLKNMSNGSSVEFPTWKRKGWRSILPSTDNTLWVSQNGAVGCALEKVNLAVGICMAWSLYYDAC